MSGSLAAMSRVRAEVALRCDIGGINYCIRFRVVFSKQDRVFGIFFENFDKKKVVSAGAPPNRSGRQAVVASWTLV